MFDRLRRSGCKQSSCEEFIGTLETERHGLFDQVHLRVRISHSIHVDVRAQQQHLRSVLTEIINCAQALQLYYRLGNMITVLPGDHPADR